MRFNDNEVRDVYDFAIGMIGNHNPNMIMHREDWEIFRDDIRGKLGEVALRRYIQEQIPEATINQGIDYNVTPRGQWDIIDLVVNNNYINVKAIKGNSNFLLVECNRYDEYGNYIYNNNDGENVRIDSYALVRVTIEPEVNRGDFNNRNRTNSLNLFLNNAWDARQRKEVQREIYAEVLGGISHREFWIRRNFAPKGIRCSYANLDAISRGVNIENLPERVRENDSRNNILQQDNYIINGTTQLHRVNQIINPVEDERDNRLDII